MQTKRKQCVKKFHLLQVLYRVGEGVIIITVNTEMHKPAVLPARLTSGYNMGIPFGKQSIEILTSAYVGLNHMWQSTAKNSYWKYFVGYNVGQNPEGWHWVPGL